MTSPPAALHCRGCGRSQSPSAIRCAHCDRELTENTGSTEDPSSQPPPTAGEQAPASSSVTSALHTNLALSTPPQRPSLDELPPTLKWWDLGAVLAVALLGIGLSLGLYNTSVSEHLLEWLKDGSAALLQPPRPVPSPSPPAGEPRPSYWMSSLVSFPPLDPLDVLIFLPPTSSQVDALSNALRRLHPPHSLVTLPLENWDAYQKLRPAAGKSWLLLKVNHGLGQVGLSLELRSAAYGIADQHGRVFVFEESKFLYTPHLLQTIAILILALVGRTKFIARYHRRRMGEYHAQEAAYRDQAYRFRQLQADVQMFVAAGEILKAYVAVNTALATAPDWTEAQALKHTLEAAHPLAASQRLPSPPLPSEPSPPSERHYLRIMRTQIRYGLPASDTTITVGRQRRKPGTGEDVGNDLVIRVPESQELSLHISRRHLEIHKIGRDCFVLDHSRRGTKLNGNSLPVKGATRLQPGDRLTIANVLVLEYLVRPAYVGAEKVDSVDVGVALEQKVPIFIEATVGDLLTVSDDEQ